MPNYLRAYRQPPEDGDPGQPGDPIRFIASTGGIKRDGLDLNQNLWSLENYKRNPVFLWVHDYMGYKPPIGRAEVMVEDEQLIADVTFDQEDDFGRQIESKYRRGYLNAVSVGWDDIKVEGQLRYDLLDISGVPVPGDPDALKERQKIALRNLGKILLDDLENFEDGLPGPETEPNTRGTTITTTTDDVELIPGQLLEAEQLLDADAFARNVAEFLLPMLRHRDAIPPHTTETMPDDTPWDGPGEVSEAEAEERVLRRMHAWVDAEADPDTKRAYKLPHHMHTGEAVWRGVAAAMSRLMQEGTQIPESDRRGAYNHLVRHYEQFERTPPEFRTLEELRSLSADEHRSLFQEGEPELFPEIFEAGLASGRFVTWSQLMDHLGEVGNSEVRAGSVLSKRNREDIESAIALLSAVLERDRPTTPTDDERTTGLRSQDTEAEGEGPEPDPEDEAQPDQERDLLSNIRNVFEGVSHDNIN